MHPTVFAGRLGPIRDAGGPAAGGSRRIGERRTGFADRGRSSRTPVVRLRPGRVASAKLAGVARSRITLPDGPDRKVRSVSRFFAVSARLARRRLLSRPGRGV